METEEEETLESLRDQKTRETEEERRGHFITRDDSKTIGYFLLFPRILFKEKTPTKLEEAQGGRC